jgi:hypothetical protein
VPIIFSPHAWVWVIKPSEAEALVKFQELPVALVSCHQLDVKFTQVFARALQLTCKSCHARTEKLRHGRKAALPTAPETLCGAILF